MKLYEVYRLAVEFGKDSDPRGRDAVSAELARKRQEFDRLPEDEKEDFDQESFWNPYPDCRILFGDPDTEVRRVLAGIDVQVGEVLLADRLSEKGEAYDLLLSHHPCGVGLAGLHEVMHMQEDIMSRLGVPINVAEALMSDRVDEVRLRIMPVNHQQAVDAARILGIPFMCCHTPADNAVAKFLTDLFDREKPELVRDVLTILKRVPEFREAAKQKAGPSVAVGGKDKRAGKVAVDMTGGTEGPKEALEKLAQAGVGTIVGMHMTDKNREEARKNHINVVLAGHMASDSLGFNLLLDLLERNGLEVTPCSGLIRTTRN